MLANEVNQLLALNNLAEEDGIVIFGGTEDKAIPLCELKQAFELNPKLYNRSITGLSITNAAELFDTCIASLYPETVLLHIGAADIALFTENAPEFDQKYRELTAHIKSLNKKCQIGIISFRNPDNSSPITEMNQHLKYLAESEQCEFIDITNRRVWNPKETKEIVSFVYSMGFMHSLSNKRPLYDLAKILFCYEPALN